MILLINGAELVLMSGLYYAAFFDQEFPQKRTVPMGGSQVMGKLSENVNHMPHKTSIEKDFMKDIERILCAVVTHNL